MSGVITEKEFDIHYSDVDLYKRAKITNTIDFFNDIAAYQSEILGIGIGYLKENNFAWVILKWEIEITKLPRYMDKVVVRTQPVGAKKFYAYRNFEIRDLEENILVNAKSLWGQIDIKNMRPIRIPDNMLEQYQIEDKKVGPLKFDKIRECKKIDNSITFKIRYGDIDTNGHVNNEKYIAWMIESVPKEIVVGYLLTKLKINYKKETKYGEEIKVLSEINKENNEIVCVHKIIDLIGQVITVGESHWIKEEIK
ncbi:acyl-[acyl-carrier-protein] thioesterase [Clostridium sp. DL1XJH146]